jgi:signal transduction histidine kinase
MEAFSWAFESRLERSKRWYAIAATIAITVTIVSFLLSAYLLGIVVILFTGVYLLYEINSHPLVHVSVTTAGISIENDLFPYSQIQSFGIIHLDNKPLLLRLRTLSRALGTIDLFLDPALNIEALRAFLINAVAEDPNAELSLIDHLLLGLRL